MGSGLSGQKPEAGVDEMKEGAMLRSVFIIIFFPAVCLGQLIDEDVLPFGGYSSKEASQTGYFTVQRLAEMHDSLGINQFTAGGFHGDQDTTYAKRFVDAGIYVYPQGSYWDGDTLIFEPQAKFANATYFVTHPDSNDYYNVRFDIAEGAINPYQDSLVLYAGSGVMLGGLKMYQRNHYRHVDGTDPIDRFRYYPILKIGAYTSGLDDSVAIGIFEVRNYTDANTLRFIDTIRVENLPSAGDTILSLTNRIDTQGLNYYQVLPDTITDTKQMSFEFQTTGACSVYVDYFQVHCQYGKELVEDGLYDDAIIEYVSRTNIDLSPKEYSVKYRLLPGNYMPFYHIYNLIGNNLSSFENIENGADNLSSFENIENGAEVISSILTK
jgi:hypothetical protein